MMTLLVDFNMVGEDGRLPAIITSKQLESLALGTRVVAADGEGTECEAVIDEFTAEGRLVMLSPVVGTTRPSAYRPHAWGSLTPVGAAYPGGVTARAPRRGAPRRATRPPPCSRAPCRWRG